MAAPKAPNLGKTGTVTLDETVFGEEFHMALVHECVKAELNAKRTGNASTLTRGEVAMTGAKAFRQKGTGRARAGALSTPQRTGGGVAFGPRPRGYSVKVNKKARRRALRSALSLHAGRGSLAVPDPSDYDTPSTKKAAEALDGFGDGGRALIVLAREGEDGAFKSLRNLRDAHVLAADAVGISDLIGAHRLVLSQGALVRLTTLAQPPQRGSGADQPEEAAA